MGESGNWQINPTGFYAPEAIRESPLGPLAELYYTNFRYAQVGLPELLGCNRIHSIANVHHELEYAVFYASDLSKSMGQLDHGGKAAKQARRATLMSLRMKFWRNHGVVDKAGNPTYGGTIKFFNPAIKQIQKQNFSETVRWLREFLRPLRAEWRSLMQAAGNELDDIYNSYTKTTRAEEAFMKHMSRVWYLLHFTKAEVALVNELAFRESDLVVAKRMLDDLAGEKLENFNWHNLQRLYAAT